ncbi:MAG TPA: glycoside hydrolase family 66 protein [Candidatus Limnocylindrales bacterium]|nr:glycoside hydrolase family 66 protein [Candidatus Limnocylindrales bacterium]
MRGVGSAALRVVDFGPTRAWFKPGSEAGVKLAVDSPGGAVDVRLALFDGSRVVTANEARLRLPAGRSIRQFRLRVPEVQRHGYGLHLQLEGRSGRAEAHSALEALQGWWESPRHAALTDFQRGSAVVPTLKRLRRWHVTVAQFYDWMYRHYRYMPPPREEDFADTLGRLVSHGVVKELVRQCRRNGIASLAYGSVYGAEREYVEGHPDELLRDAAGQPLSLGGTFFITDLRSQSPWRRRLIGEYARACRRFGFDGIHMDQYGEPHEGFAADGSVVKLQELFAGLIDEAADHLAKLSPPRRVLFNCVGGWPLEHVGRARSAATYIEIWPPDTTYSAITRQIDIARRVAPTKQVIVAAYPSVLAADGDGGRPAGNALEAALLLTTVVLATGAYHHVLAEHDRVLVGGYYPDAVSLPSRAAESMRLAWQFSARYVHLLSDTRNVPVPIDQLVIEMDGRVLPVSSEPQAGAVWVRGTRTGDNEIAIQLVDLLGQVSDEWDAPRKAAVRRENWRVSWRDGSQRPSLFASPWSYGGAMQQLSPGRVIPIPAFERWAMLITDDWPRSVGPTA